MPFCHVFLVKTWSFFGQGTSGDSDYPFLNVVEGPFSGGDFYYLNYTHESNYHWGTPMEVSYTIGTHGQNNPKPAALFGLHLLVSTLNPDVFYDPSYGLKHTSLQSIDDTLSGFLLNETIHTSGPVKGLMLFQKNKAGIQIYLKD